METKKENKTDIKAVIEEKGVIAFVPTGNSMWPFLKNKGQSVVIKAKTARLSLFDVGFFLRSDKTPVLHRVVEVKDEGYVFCGDSQFLTEFVKEDDVFGVMDGFYKGKKYVSAHDGKYLKKVAGYYRRKTLRKIRIKLFHVKNRLFKNNKG